MSDTDFIGKAMDRAVAHWLVGIETSFTSLAKESFTGQQVADFIKKLRLENLPRG